VRASRVHLREPQRYGGVLELSRARVRWFLSIDRSDVPAGAAGPYRSIAIDGHEVDFAEGFTDLHTKVYAETLAGRGFTIADARPSIELVHDIRTATPVAADADAHPRVLALAR